MPVSPLAPSVPSPMKREWRRRHPTMALVTCLIGIVSCLVGGDQAAGAELPDDPSPQSRTARPNIVLIMADDLGWGDVGFNGNNIIQTPHLDALASQGLVLRRFYAAAPVCSPTRGSVLTGRHPRRYGIDFANVGHLPDDEFNLAQVLQRAGYRTGHFGKWHLGTLTQTEDDANRGGPNEAQHFAPPQQRGFDVCFSTESKVPTFDPLVKPKAAGNQWWNALAATDESVPYGTAYWNEKGNKVAGTLRGDDSRLIVEQATRFIEQSAAQPSPFLAVIWFHAPHLPVVASDEDRARYESYDEYAQHYFGCITAMDRAIGDLRGTLDRLQIDESTIVMFCSDNGPEGLARRSPQDAARAPGTAGSLRGRKRDLFEGGIRVPAIICWPGEIQPGVTDAAATTMDYAPTVLDVLNLKTDAAQLPFDGISLKPLLEGRPFERPHPIVFYSRGRIAVMDGPWKWVSYPPRGTSASPSPGQRPQGQTWLFDLSQDQSESTDLKSKHPDIARQLQDAWEDFLKSSNIDRGRLGLSE